VIVINRCKLSLTNEFRLSHSICLGVYNRQPEVHPSTQRWSDWSRGPGRSRSVPVRQISKLIRILDLKQNKLRYAEILRAMRA